MLLGREGAFPRSCGSAWVAQAASRWSLGELGPPWCLSSRQTKDKGILPAGTWGSFPKALLEPRGPLETSCGKWELQESMDLFALEVWAGEEDEEEEEEGALRSVGFCNIGFEPFRRGFLLLEPFLPHLEFSAFPASAQCHLRPGVTSDVPSCPLPPCASARGRSQLGSGTNSLAQPRGIVHFWEPGAAAQRCG